MSDTLHETPGGAPAPTPDPTASSVDPPWATVPAPTAPAPKKNRSLTATIGLLVIVVVVVTAIRLLVHAGTNAALSTVSGQNSVPAASQPAASAPATVANPALPLAASPGGVVEAVEAYRNKAWATGDMSQLENYYPSHNEAWQADYGKIVTQGLRDPGTKIVTVELISQSDTQIVANVTYHDGLQPDWTLKNTYQVLPQVLSTGTVNRWFLTDQAGI